MVDQASLQILGTVHKELAARMNRIYTDVSTRVGLAMKPTSGLRSLQEQMTLWRLGRDDDGLVIDASKVVTQARPGNSYHCFGLAVDSAFAGSDPYMEKHPEKDKIWNQFCEIVKIHGLESGCDFKFQDRPHAQMRCGMGLKQIQDLYAQGGLLGVWKKIDQLIQNA